MLQEEKQTQKKNVFIWCLAREDRRTVSTLY